MDAEQELAEGFKLYPSSLFCSQPYLMKPQAVAVHCCNASWREVQTPLRNYINNLKIILKRVLVRSGLRREKAIDDLR